MALTESRKMKCERIDWNIPIEDWLWEEQAPHPEGERPTGALETNEKGPRDLENY
jgi:hypothetical protein